MNVVGEDEEEDGEVEEDEDEEAEIKEEDLLHLLQADEVDGDADDRKKEECHPCDQ